MLTAGFVAWGAKKLSQPDVQKIEQSTGKSYEDLSDAEVQQAVTTLGIEAQPQTPRSRPRSRGNPSSRKSKSRSPIRTAEASPSAGWNRQRGSLSHGEGAAVPAVAMPTSGQSSASHRSPHGGGGRCLPPQPA